MIINKLKSYRIENTYSSLSNKYCAKLNNGSF